MRQLKDFKKITFTTICQSLFLTIKYFIQNGLLSYASACSFDLLFSVTPIIMMIVMILIRVVKAVHQSTAIIDTIFTMIFEKVPELQTYLDPETIISSVTNIKLINPLEIILVLFIIWMARRLFASIFASMRNIFHDQQKRQPLLNQVLAVVFELVIILTAIAIVITFATLQTILSMPVFHTIPQLDFIFEGFLSESFVSNFLPNLFIFITITILYLGAAGTKPGFWLSSISGFLCTGSFWIFRFILHLTVDVSRYNMIYGVLAQVIILLMDIFFFFVFFLFFAQFIFVFQFFDELLLGEIYLLPKDTKESKMTYLYRQLFIRPDFLMAKYSSVLHFSEGETIYTPGSDMSDAYYITSGTVEVIRNETVEIFQEGSFFGEMNCILNQSRNSSAIAKTDVLVVVIKAETFRLLVDQNPSVAQKVLGQVSSYFTTVYGLTNNPNSDKTNSLNIFFPL